MLGHQLDFVPDSFTVEVSLLSESLFFSLPSNSSQVEDH
jgi:hypothetical protein